MEGRGEEEEEEEGKKEGEKEGEEGGRHGGRARKKRKGGDEKKISPHRAP